MPSTWTRPSSSPIKARVQSDSHGRRRDGVQRPRCRPPFHEPVPRWGETSPSPEIVDGRKIRVRRSFAPPTVMKNTLSLRACIEPMNRMEWTVPRQRLGAEHYPQLGNGNLRIPTGFRPKAQGWRIAPTLGRHRHADQPHGGCVKTQCASVATPLGLKPISSRFPRVARASQPLYVLFHAIRLRF